MTKIDFIAQEKNGVNEITLAPPSKRKARHFGIIDGVLILGFLAAFVGLVLLLAK